MPLSTIKSPVFWFFSIWPFSICNPIFRMVRLLDYMNKAAKPRPDEDVVDSANNRITVFLFLLMGLSVFAKEYYGNPIKCWGKPEWTSSWLQYAEDYCFVEGTFFTQINKTLPESDVLEDKGKKVNFYQWIPIVFHLMGFLMLLPRYYWSFMNWISCRFILYALSNQSYV